MKVWIVFVKVLYSDCFAARYFDSMWASERHALDRRTELSNAFRVFGCESKAKSSEGNRSTGAEVQIFEAQMADASIPDGAMANA